jgi:glycosyltransferase involved in cell wall biosynthesis
MHVLMLTERLPPAIGGVERHVAGLTQVLVARGCRVTLVAPKDDSMLPDEREIAGARVIRLPRLGRGRWDYVQAWCWWAYCRCLLDEADVIHFHGVYALLHWFGPIRILCLHKPVYLTYHGYEMRYPIPTRARLYRCLADRLTRGSLCVGHYLVKWFDLHPASVIYGAVTGPTEPPAPSDTPQAVFVGRLAADTGLDIYVQALGRLRRETGWSLSLTVCGDGPLRVPMETLARKEGVNARFFGFVVDPIRYLTQARVAFVSGYLAILEAMAWWRPIFSVYHNPVKESYLRDIPRAEEMLHIAGSPTELADQLADHLHHPTQAAAMLEQAAAFAGNWTWDRLADEYLQLWTR